MRFFYFFLPKAVLQRGPFFSSLVKLKSLCSMPNHIQRPSIVILYQKMANTLYSKKKKKTHSTWRIRREEFNLLNCDKVWLGRL